MSDTIQDRKLNGCHHHNLFPVLVLWSKPMGQTDKSSGTKSKLQESSKLPLIECDGGDEGTGSKKRQSKRARSSEIHLSCERRRRDRLRERMKALKELLPNNSNSKSDQATILDQAVRHIKSLQSQLHVLSSGGVYPAYRVPGMPAAYDQPLEGFGTDSGMAIQAGFSPLSCLMAPPPSNHYSTTTTYPTPRYSMSTHHHHITTNLTPQHGVWDPNTHEMLLGSITGIGYGLIENDDTHFPGQSNLGAWPSQQLISTPLSTPQPPFNHLQVMSTTTTTSTTIPINSVAPSRCSTFKHYPHGESSYQVHVPSELDMNQTSRVQDPFAMIQPLYGLPPSLSSGTLLEMVSSQINENATNADLGLSQHLL